jgi:hypothetical protein
MKEGILEAEKHASRSEPLAALLAEALHSSRLYCEVRGTVGCGVGAVEHLLVKKWRI